MHLVQSWGILCCCYCCSLLFPFDDNAFTSREKVSKTTNAPSGFKIGLSKGCFWMDGRARAFADDATLKCKQADSPRKKDKSVWHANRFKLEEKAEQHYYRLHTNSKRWKDPQLRSAVVTTLGLEWIQSGNMVCMLTKLDFFSLWHQSLKIAQKSFLADF